MRKNTEEQKQIKKVEQDQDIEFGKQITKNTSDLI